jgi:hypothetical protein
MSAAPVGALPGTQNSLSNQGLQVKPQDAHTTSEKPCKHQHRHTPATTRLPHPPHPSIPQKPAIFHRKRPSPTPAVGAKKRFAENIGRTRRLRDGQARRAVAIYRPPHTETSSNSPQPRSGRLLYHLNRQNNPLFILPFPKLHVHP